MDSKPRVWDKAWKYCKDYRCRECRGSANILDGKVTVEHKLHCSLWEYIVTNHPKLVNSL